MTKKILILKVKEWLVKRKTKFPRLKEYKRKNNLEYDWRSDKKKEKKDEENKNK